MPKRKNRSFFIITVYFGPNISSGLTHWSNCSGVKIPSLMAVSLKLPPSLWAVFAIWAACNRYTKHEIQLLNTLSEKCFKLKKKVTQQQTERNDDDGRMNGQKDKRQGRIRMHFRTDSAKLCFYRERCVLLMCAADGFLTIDASHTRAAHLRRTAT